MRAFSIQRLEIFKTVYEVGSISEAARRLRLSQPTLSRHMRYFEDALKLRLFAIERGRLKPTFEAHRLYEECQGAFNQLMRAEMAVAGLRRGQDELLRIIVTPSLVSHPALERAVKRLLDQRPQTRVVIDLGGSVVQLRALREGEAELGLSAGLPVYPDIEATRLGRVQMVALVPHDHPLATSKRFPLSALGTHDCVLLSNQGPLGRWLMGRLESLGIEPKTRATVVSPTLIPGFVETLGCCGVLDSSTARLAAGRRLKVLPLEENVHFDLQAIRLAMSPERQSAGIFVAALRTLLGDAARP